MSKILEVVGNDKNLSILIKGVKAVGLEEILDGPGPFTVFAPTDHAFKKLPEGEFENLVKPENIVRLSDILNYHVVRGKTNAKQFSDGQRLKTVNGQIIKITIKEDTISINGAKMQTRDIEASNGIIHYVDTVVMPAL